ncbi:MFS transporter [Vibrio sp. D404a]|uniref:MFS transporter n=1 Tax=unclassified Vibrio TaxID=2614977 RepID=UPI002552AE66|nr:MULTISPECIES: MFS transporter [unclassified Vibrio]MDK9736814.1 MFS transporter [Vibrio sp. D404a]MDK9795768.1 MFS transporter [Vibrio sp. D449a]
MSVINNKKFQLMSIGLISSLMGIGQNGLLVSLPFLVEQSAFDLPTWSVLIAVGSLLFLPSAPFWGRYSDKHGPNRVVIQALSGMTVSFLLLALFSMVSKTNDINVTLCFIGLIAARVIYGCTVSGMVPASQHWAILLCGEQQRLRAITAVSIGLSSGRLLGPVVSIFSLKLSPFAPLFLMVALPFLALIIAIFIPIPKAEVTTSNNKKEPWLPNKILFPYLFSGLFLCASVALLQYSLSPLIHSFTDWPSEKLSDAIGVLLTISAGVTLLTQVWVVKREKVTPTTMYRLGAVMLLGGMLLFVVPHLVMFSLAMTVTAIGAALLVPAYTASATSQLSRAPGSVAGYISMFHTLGYGLAAALAFSVVINPIYPIYLCALFSALIMGIAYWVNRENRRSVQDSCGS